ncbi:MAG: hypothetical protein Fues2KO_08280 [Fuerstiella sp.]
MIYRSDKIRILLDTARRYARSNGTILIEGESGTGKELVARFIHEHSSRTDRPYLKVNCGAFADSLIDSALFGHERGAFTGADVQRVGCFEAAADGTLFLDEVGELPLPQQARLLRVLEDGEFFRIGSYQTQQSQARIIAATNRDLRAEVAAGRFREDLYFRLSLLQVQVPPLRDRREDIPLLAKSFLNDGSDVPSRSFTEPAMRELTTYDWPGNVRELLNVVQRASLNSDECVIDAVELDQPTLLPFPNDKAIAQLRSRTLKDIEQRVIEDRVQYLGSRKAAAESLGISDRTIRNRLAVAPVEPETTTDNLDRPRLRLRTA